MLSYPGFVRLDPSLGLAVYWWAIRMDGQVPKSSRNHCYHGRIGGHACGLPSDLYSNLTTHENELIAKEERWRYSNFSYRFNVGIDFYVLIQYRLICFQCDIRRCCRGLLPNSTIQESRCSPGWNHLCSMQVRKIFKL